MGSRLGSPTLFPEPKRDEPELQRYSTPAEDRFPDEGGSRDPRARAAAKWEAEGLYRQILRTRARKPTLFVLHDGPPFANGDVHMGTALNKVLKDLIVNSKSMAGFRAPYVPGWDCHGLPIEFKVVKESRGLSPVEVRQQDREEYARKYHRHPARPIQAARRLRRLGESVSHARARLRSGDHPRLCDVRGKGPRVSVEEARLLEHRRADRAGRGRGGIRGPHGPRDLCEIPDRHRCTRRQGQHGDLDDDAVDAAGQRRHRRCIPKHEYVVGQVSEARASRTGSRFVVAKPLLEAFDEADRRFRSATEVALDHAAPNSRI